MLRQSPFLWPFFSNLTSQKCPKNHISFIRYIGAHFDPHLPLMPPREDEKFLQSMSPREAKKVLNSLGLPFLLTFLLFPETVTSNSREKSAESRAKKQKVAPIRCLLHRRFVLQQTLLSYNPFCHFINKLFSFMYKKCLQYKEKSVSFHVSSSFLAPFFLFFCQRGLSAACIELPSPPLLPSAANPANVVSFLPALLSSPSSLSLGATPKETPKKPLPQRAKSEHRQFIYLKGSLKVLDSVVFYIFWKMIYISEKTVHDKIFIFLCLFLSMSRRPLLLSSFLSPWRSG